MIQTLFRSEDLPPEERLSRLSDLWVHSAHPMRPVSDTSEDPRATIRMLDLAAVNVVELTLSPFDVLRTPKLIRQADPELLPVMLSLDGNVVVSQSRRDAVLSPQEFALYDSSRPFRLRIVPGGETATLVRAHLPRATLGLSGDGLARLLATPLSGRTGFGALLTRFLAEMTTGSTAYRPGDLPRLGALAHDLLTAVVARHLDADSAVPEESQQRTLLLRVETFVRQHLHDPELSPETVAAAHHISVSHLHRLFRTREVTLAAWIRRQRLEHARRDLADPVQRDVPIHRIAARWGFKDHATFTRAFHSAYGAPPKDYRQVPVPV